MIVNDMKNNKLIMNVSDYTLIINYKYYKDIFYTCDQVVLYKNSDIISSIYRYIHDYDDSILKFKKIINLKDCLLNYKNVKYYSIKQLYDIRIKIPDPVINLKEIGNDQCNNI